jgi:serine protease Do
MKTKVIILFVAIISIFSWLFWSFMMMFYFNNYYLTNTWSINNQPNKIEQINKFVTIWNIENEITNIVKNLSPWVVSIVIKKDLTLYKRDPWWFLNTPVWTFKTKVWWWTWFFVSKDGTIITNKHVIVDEDAEYSVITNDWEEYNATVLAIDPLTDLAIIKIDSFNEFKTLDFIEDEETINIWQFWIAIWNSLAEFQNSVSLWVISWKNRSIDVWDWVKLSWLLQTDAAINPWNSWGPLVNLSWEVIGINTAIVGNTNSLWFSIPLSKRKVEFILDSIKKYLEIKKPFIWINYLILHEWVKNELWVNVDYWAYIFDEEWSIVKWSQAEKAWLERWDIILEVNWIKVSLSNDLNGIIQNNIPGDILNLLLLKSNWEQKNVMLELWMSE